MFALSCGAAPDRLSLHAENQENLAVKTPISLLRLAAAMFVAALVAALALAIALHVMAHSGPETVVPGPAQLFGMSVFFTFFTVPVAAVLALPVGWLWQRFGPFSAWLCAVLGAAGGVLAGYGLLLLSFVPVVRWESVLWFGLGGAAAGLAVGLIMGNARPATT